MELSFGKHAKKNLPKKVLVDFHEHCEGLGPVRDETMKPLSWKANYYAPKVERLVHLKNFMEEEIPKKEKPSCLGSRRSTWGVYNQT